AALLGQLGRSACLCGQHRTAIDLLLHRTDALTRAGIDRRRGLEHAAHARDARQGTAGTLLRGLADVARGAGIVVVAAGTGRRWCDLQLAGALPIAAREGSLEEVTAFARPHAELAAVAGVAVVALGIGAAVAIERAAGAGAGRRAAFVHRAGIPVVGTDD